MAERKDYRLDAADVQRLPNFAEYEGETAILNEEMEGFYKEAAKGTEIIVEVVLDPAVVEPNVEDKEGDQVLRRGVEYITKVSLVTFHNTVKALEKKSKSWLLLRFIRRV